MLLFLLFFWGEGDLSKNQDFNIANRGSNVNKNLLPKVFFSFCKESPLPQKIKADDGTEHALIQPIHIYLASVANPNAASDSFSIVTSPRNQRIEAYWSLLQRDKIGWWRRFFRDLMDNDMLATEDPVVLDCIRYCCMDLI